MLQIKKNVLLTLLMAATLLVAGCGDGGDRQAKYLEKGQQNYEEGNFDKAKIELKNVLQINPNNAEARFLLGMIELESKNYRAAYGNFQSSSAADPTYIAPKIALARLLLLANQGEQSREIINEILALEPDNGQALGINAGIALTVDKNEEEAFDLAKKAIELDPASLEGTQVLGKVYLARKEPEKALESLDAGISNQSTAINIEALKVQRLEVIMDSRDIPRVSKAMEALINDYPDNDSYAFAYVNYLLSFKELSESERKDLTEAALNKLIAERPDKEVYKLWMSEFLTKNRDVEEGIDKLKSYIDEQPELFVLRSQLATAYINTGENELAKALFEEVINQDGDSSDAVSARIQLAKIAIKEGDSEGALKFIEQALEKDSENNEALLLRGEMSLTKGDTDAAISDARRSLRSNPSSQPSLLLLARAYRTAGSTDLALDNYQSLLAISPRNLEALVGASQLLISRNRLDDALKSLELALEVQPNNLEAIRMLTDLYSRDQRWDDALNVSGKMLEDEKTAALGHYLQGRTYIRKRDLEKAIVSLEKSLDLDSRIIESLSALVGAYNATNQTPKAIDYLQSHIKDNPDHDHAVELLAGIYNVQGNFKQVEKLLTDLVEKSPERISAHRSLSAFYIQQERYDDSEKALLNALNASEKNKNIRLTLAEFYQFRDRLEDAIKVYDEVLADNPNSLVVKNNLANLLVDNDPTPEKIARAAELSLELATTETPAFLDTAGWVKYHEGNYPQAISLIQAAISQGGSGPVYYYHLGMAYFKNDMKGSAKDALSKALADPGLDFPGKAEAQKTFDSL